jgi:hypothetical protein
MNLSFNSIITKRKIVQKQRFNRCYAKIIRSNNTLKEQLCHNHRSQFTITDALHEKKRDHNYEDRREDCDIDIDNDEVRDKIKNINFANIIAKDFP